MLTYVYLFEPVKRGQAAVSLSIMPFSNKWKAQSYCNREFDKPDFTRFLESPTTVSVDGSVVGWITKKLVQ